jgi:hypothetical protein
MAHVVRRVQRPALLVAFCVFAFVAHVGAMGALLGIRDSRLATPAAIASRSDALGEALAQAPWLGPETIAPELWLVTRPDCRACAQFEANVLHDLASSHVGVRVVVVAPRELGDRFEHPQRFAAALARTRDWSAVKVWGEAAGRLDPQRVALIEEPSVVEGYVEWGRASLDRMNEILTENGVEPELPMLLWRRGGEWRVLTGAKALSIDPVRRDMAPES